MSFKTFDLAHDVASLISPINEVVSVSSDVFRPIFAGGSDTNVRFYVNIATGSQVGLPSHYGYWQTVFDSNPSSIQSTALFDLSFGYSSGSSYYGDVVSISASANEKLKVYKEMASSLLGDPNALFKINGSDVKECFFVLVKRSIMKDELKKGSVVVYMTGTMWGADGAYVTGSDVGANQNFKQTVGGDYAPLLNAGNEVGQVWYNAGVVVIPAFLTETLMDNGDGLPWTLTGSGQNYPNAWSGSNGGNRAGASPTSLSGCMASCSIDELVDGFRGHIRKIDFHNQTNLYSTIYFCRATNTEFNYSSNPTYTDENQRIRVTSGSNVLQSRTYITTIGLYDANDNLLAVGKLNKPITKAPDTEAIFRVRLDY